MSTQEVVVRLEQQADYQFKVSFEGTSPITCDEPPPLGRGSGPSPVQLLAAAVGNCLCDSLLFAFRKFKDDPGTLAAEVTAQIGRSPQGRLRVVGIRVTLHLGMPAAKLLHLDRVLAQFEEFCTVTQSVAAAIPIELSVLDSTGTKLK